MAEQEVVSPVTRKGSKIGSNQPMSPGRSGIANPWLKPRRQTGIGGCWPGLCAVITSTIRWEAKTERHKRDVFLGVLRAQSFKHTTSHEESLVCRADDLRKDFKLSSSRARAVTADPVQSMCGQLVPQCLAIGSWFSVSVRLLD
jgi:hypothetical protein